MRSPRKPVLHKAPVVAAALVVRFRKSRQWNAVPIVVDAKLIPVQVIDFYRGNP